MLLEEVKLETPKTKEWAEIIKALPLQNKKTLCIVKEIDQNLERAGRNMEKFVKLKRARDLNAYHLLRREKVLIEQEALPVIENRLLGSNPGQAKSQEVKP